MSKESVARIKKDLIEDRIPHTRKDRLVLAIERSGLSRSSIARKVCELGGSLQDSQIKRLEEGQKTSLSIDDWDLFFKVVGVNSSFIFPSAMDENNLEGHTKRCLAKIIESGDMFAFYEVITGAAKNTKELTRDFNYDLKIYY